ncbi:MAG: TIR domain-containing protein [Sphingomicrobium sp.]
MTDVFVSYARQDEPHATLVADTLRAAGYRAWRDDEIPAHRPYAEVIEERLKSAKAVVVLWSAEAAKSQWVRAEADAARSAGKLVQTTIDKSIPPMPFNQIQCADLSNWDGDVEAPGWRKLRSSVGELAGPPPSATVQPAARPRGQVSICVLPFQNMSGDAEQEYFSDGISEDITTDLSKVSALGVIARNTAFTFKGQAVNVCEIARTLGVSHVLEGSVRKVGGRVRITAQLIDGATGDHVWAERFDRNLDDIFAIQDEISEAIVGALKVKLLPKERQAIEKRGTDNAEAYNLYLLARQYWVTGNHGDIRREERVMRICSRAVEIDPYYAQAWALLALAQSNLRYGFGQQVDDGVAAAHTALSIDPSIAEAYCPKARRLEERQRYGEAMAEIEKALKLDPESWSVNKEAARLHMLHRQIPEARCHFEKAAEVMESDFHAWALLLTCCEALGDKEGALQAAEMMVAQSEKAIAEDPSNVAAMGISACGLAALGERERARERIERAMLIDPDNLNMRYNFACVLAVQLKDPEAALDQLQRTLTRCAVTQVRLAENDPDFDTIRDHPRFQKLIGDARKRLGIEEPVESQPVAAAVSPNPS